MSATESIWYLFVLVGALYSVSNWKHGIYLGILIDVLRDIVRKLTPEQPVLITLSGAAFWGVLVFGSLIANPGLSRELTRFFPRLKTALYLLLLAILPAAAISIASYTDGWKFALIGAASYLVPLVGIVAGYGVMKSERDAISILRWYVVVNSIMLVSVPMEYLDLNVPALGGIKYDWIRYSGTVTVNLMCGWYRSPDIMGLHAAHVIVFCLMLSLRARAEAQVTWLSIVIWAGFCVLLSGRRKMIGIPMVFLAAFLVLGTIMGIRRINRIVGFCLAGVLFSASLALTFWDQDSYFEYTDFASTMFTDGVDRSNEVIVGSTVATLHQSGILGAGLGTGTQGRYHMGKTSDGPRTWQEDGVSRLFLEFGVPGVLILIAAAFQIIMVFRRAVLMVVPGTREQLLQLGLISAVAGDSASYAISHQQFSGDPVNGLMVTILAGMALALAKISYRNYSIAVARTEAVPASP